MDPRAEYEVGHGTMMPALTPDFAAVLVVGMHAKSGTPRAFLEHTVDPHWHRYWINSVEHGEFALITFMAAAAGVPTVFVAGDCAAIEEALALVPAIETCVVKDGLARDWCRSLAPAVAHEQIRTGVARALTRRREVVCPVLDLPATVRLEFNRCTGADAYDSRPGMTRIDGFTIEWTAHLCDELLPF
jgi:D-amino peptidase